MKLLASLPGTDIQKVAIWLLGIGYILNTAWLCLISVLQDGHANAAIVQSLTDSQHYSILALGAVGGVHAISSIAAALSSGSSKSPAGTAE